MFYLIVFSFVLGAISILFLEYYGIVKYFNTPSPTHIPLYGQYHKYELPQEILVGLKNDSHDENSSLAINLLLQFLFKELKDTGRIKRWIVNKIYIELQDLITTSTVGKILKEIRVKDVNLGSYFPIIQNLEIEKIVLDSNYEHIEELNITMLFEYKDSNAPAVLLSSPSSPIPSTTSQPPPENKQYLNSSKYDEKSNKIIDVSPNSNLVELDTAVKHNLAPFNDENAMQNLGILSNSSKLTKANPQNIIEILPEGKWGKGFIMTLDADLSLVGRVAASQVTINIAELRGPVRLRFSRLPYTHWSFMFLKDPLMNINVDCILRNKHLPQIASIIASQIKKSIKKRHTFPHYKIRLKPFFHTTGSSPINSPDLSTSNRQSDINPPEIINENIKVVRENSEVSKEQADTANYPPKPTSNVSSSGGGRLFGNLKTKLMGGGVRRRNKALTKSNGISVINEETTSLLEYNSIINKGDLDESVNTKLDQDKANIRVDNENMLSGKSLLVEPRFIVAEKDKEEIQKTPIPLILLGRLNISIIEVCRLLPNLPENSSVYLTISLGEKSLKNMNDDAMTKFRATHWKAYHKYLVRNLGQTSGFFCKQQFVIEKGEMCIVIDGVLANSPAQLIDLRKGDVIISLNGHIPSNSRQANKIINQFFYNTKNTSKLSIVAERYSPPPPTKRPDKLLQVNFSPVDDSKKAIGAFNNKIIDIKIQPPSPMVSHNDNDFTSEMYLKSSSYNASKYYKTGFNVRKLKGSSYSLNIVDGSVDGENFENRDQMYFDDDTNEYEDADMGSAVIRGNSLGYRRSLSYGDLSNFRPFCNSESGPQLSSSSTSFYIGNETYRENEGKVPISEFALEESEEEQIETNFIKSVTPPKSKPVTMPLKLVHSATNLTSPNMPNYPNNVKIPHFRNLNNDNFNPSSIINTALICKDIKAHGNSGFHKRVHSLPENMANAQSFDLRLDNGALNINAHDLPVDKGANRLRQDVGVDSLTFHEKKTDYLTKSEQNYPPFMMNWRAMCSKPNQFAYHLLESSNTLKSQNIDYKTDIDWKPNHFSFNLFYPDLATNNNSETLILLKKCQNTYLNICVWYETQLNNKIIKTIDDKAKGKNVGQNNLEMTDNHFKMDSDTYVIGQLSYEMDPSTFFAECALQENGKVNKRLEIQPPLDLSLKIPDIFLPLNNKSRFYRTNTGQQPPIFEYKRCYGDILLSFAFQTPPSSVSLEDGKNIIDISSSRFDATFNQQLCLYKFCRENDYNRTGYLIMNNKSLIEGQEKFELQKAVLLKSTNEPLSIQNIVTPTTSTSAYTTTHQTSGNYLRHKAAVGGKKLIKFGMDYIYQKKGKSANLTMQDTGIFNSAISPEANIIELAQDAVILNNISKIDDGSPDDLTKWDAKSILPINELKVTTIPPTFNVDTLISLVHSFVLKQFPKGTLCQYCGKKIWLKMAFCCSKCSMICHKKCLIRCQNGTLCSKNASTGNMILGDNIIDGSHDSDVLIKTEPPKRPPPPGINNANKLYSHLSLTPRIIKSTHSYEAINTDNTNFNDTKMSKSTLTIDDLYKEGGRDIRRRKSNSDEKIVDQNIVKDLKAFPTYNFNLDNFEPKCVDQNYQTHDFEKAGSDKDKEAILIEEAKRLGREMLLHLEIDERKERLKSMLDDIKREMEDELNTKTELLMQKHDMLHDINIPQPTRSMMRLKRRQRSGDKIGGKESRNEIFEQIADIQKMLTNCENRLESLSFIMLQYSSALENCDLKEQKTKSQTPLKVLE